MFQRIGLFVFAFALILAAQTASAQVLVFSPHPVDEALFTAGVIYRARQNGQTVKVVVATNGDCASSTVGHVREQETIAAMGLLGLSPDDVIFLGYPDCGLRFLYYYYTGADAEFTSDAGFTRTYAYEGLGNTDYHKYIYGASANYSGFSIIQDLKTVLRNYKPQDIYTTSGWDASTDHWTFNFLLGEAILANMRDDATFQPTLHDGFINAPCDGCDPSYRWPMPSFTPTTNFPAPPYLPTTPLAWSDVESVEVPSVMQSTSTSTNLKYQAIAQYTSQGGAGNPWLEAFAKRDEIFWKWELWANLALKAVASASSTASAATADRVNDGVVVGYPVVPSVGRGGKGEWVSNGQLAGAWVQVTWPAAQQVTKVVVHDRPGPAENISAGTLTFSDGSSLPVGPLPENGVGVVLQFPQKSVTWVRFTVDNASGTAVGLSELEVYGPPTSKLPPYVAPVNTQPSITSGPTAAPTSITDAATSTITVSAFDADSDALTYTWTTSGGHIEGSGASITFVPPTVNASTSYRIDVFAADGRGGVATSFVNVTVTPSGAPQNIALIATATASSGANRQTADKAIDDVVSGYPADAQREWASVGQLVGAWIQLTWSAPHTISRSELHDRINSSDQILGGILRFSDGTSLPIGTLPNDGAELVTDFSPRTVTWIRLEVTSARGGSVGLAEWRVFTGGASGSNTAPQITSGPLATAATITDAQTSSLSVTATDANGDTLTYAWSAASGSITGSGSTVTFTPPHVMAGTTVRIDVQVTDGHGGLAAGFVNVTVNPSNPEVNLALFAAAAASTENSSRGQGAIKAIDGFVDGYPTDSTKEWAAVGQRAGAWIQLTWTSAQNVSRVTLHDRINTGDQILSGTLSFSDGSSIPVGALANNGTGLVVEFSARSVTWIRFTVGSANGENTGLAEIEVYGPSGIPNGAPQITSGPFATPPTITDIETTTVSVAAVDPDANPLTYTWQVASGTITGSGASVTFTPPRIVADTTYRINVTVSDGHGGSVSGFVDVLVHPSSTLIDVARSAAVTASTENGSRGQGANKAIDGIASGYPADPTAEWATVGQLAGAWIQLDWSGTQSVSHIVLHDRINGDDQVLGATLSFSDGSTLAVGALTNDGTGVQLDFPAKNVAWIRLTITSARGANIGLAEFEVY